MSLITVKVRETFARQWCKFYEVTNPKKSKNK